MHRGIKRTQFNTTNKLGTFFKQQKYHCLLLLLSVSCANAFLFFFIIMTLLCHYICTFMPWITLSSGNLLLFLYPKYIIIICRGFSIKMGIICCIFILASCAHKDRLHASQYLILFQPILVARVLTLTSVSCVWPHWPSWF